MLPGVVFQCPRVRIPCVGNAIPGKLSLICDQNVRQLFVAVVAAIHRIIHGWHDLSVKDVVLFEGGMVESIMVQNCTL
jgi:hypothetical protein